MPCPIRLLPIRFLLPILIGLTWVAPSHGQITVQPVRGDHAPPGGLEVLDVRNDDGSALIVRWQRSPDDVLEPPEAQRIQGYIVQRADGPDWEYDEVGPVRGPATWMFLPPVDEFINEPLPRRKQFMYRVAAIGLDGTLSEWVETDQPVAAQIWWFDRSKSWFLALTIIASFWIIFFIYLARTGAALKIRKIAGLEAVDEAVGRATEMGRSILFVPGIQDMNNIQTVAGITVLSRIARLTAEYDARMEVPTSRSLVMTTARETMEASYLAAGRPDSYHEDMSYYVTDEQFGYVAYLAGYMVREKPAACFYLGAFFAESLILAETGNSIGAIQVAGTAEPAQLPFFVAACDYTLIGEEFFAASAYLSGEPEQLGSLKGQDVGKILGGLLLIIGCVLATLTVINPDTFQQADIYLREHILGMAEGGE